MTEDLNASLLRRIADLEQRVATLERLAVGPSMYLGMFKRTRDDLRNETPEQMIARVRKWAKKLNAAGDEIE